MSLIQGVQLGKNSRRGLRDEAVISLVSFQGTCYHLCQSGVPLAKPVSKPGQLGTGTAMLQLRQGLEAQAGAEIELLDEWA